jgi:hypothetical protein
MQYFYKKVVIYFYVEPSNSTFLYHAIQQVNDAIAVGCVLFGMGHLDDCHAFFPVSRGEHPHDFFALLGIEVAGRFVGKQ